MRESERPQLFQRAATSSAVTVRGMPMPGWEGSVEKRGMVREGAAKVLGSGGEVGVDEV